MLGLIVDRWHEYSDCPRLKGPHLLQVVALYADVETVLILTGMHHLRMRYDKDYALGDFKAHLHQRPDATEKLVIAFNELLHIINASPDMRESLTQSRFVSDCGLSDSAFIDDEENGKPRQ